VVLQPYAAVGNRSYPGVLFHSWRPTVLRVIYPDNLHSLSEEISSQLEMFSGVNENFATATIEGALAMAGDSVDLDGVRITTVESGVDVLPARHDIRRAT
jgi:hypothetical protein